jgi:hypothetical protein
MSELGNETDMPVWSANVVLRSRPEVAFRGRQDPLLTLERTTGFPPYTYEVEIFRSQLCDNLSASSSAVMTEPAG